MQAVPAAYSWQLPAPLQKPVVPHVAADCAAHSLSGSVLAGMLVHNPFAEAPLAADAVWQLPLQAVFEQKPSEQNPVWHWLAAEQAAPWANRTGVVQTPPLQTPDEQLPLATHCLPTPQAPQDPPQSTSVSVPFLIKSLHVGGASIVHVDEHPSPLVALPSSHCSTPTRMKPSPQTLLRQNDVHALMLLFRAPLSHCSPATGLTKPSPQMERWQVGVQLTEPEGPGSHCSPAPA